MKSQLPLKILMAFALAFQAVPSYAAEGGEESVCENEKKKNCGDEKPGAEGAFKSCEDAIGTAKVGAARLAEGVKAGDVGETKGMFDMGGQTQANCSVAAQANERAKCLCQNAKEVCAKTTNPKTLPKIDENLTAATGGLDQAKSCVASGNDINDKTNEKDNKPGKSGGSMDPMVAGLMGAALGAGAMMLLNQKEEEGSADAMACDKQPEEGPKYADCDEYYTTECTKAYSAGTALPAGCDAFFGRYCNLNKVGVTADQPTTVNVGGKEVPLTLGGNGKGVGTTLCQAVAGKAFCDTVASANKTVCPSCIQAENMKSAECQANPASCVLQHSQADIAKAQVLCQGDPMFSDPTYLAGGGATVPVTGLPAVTLPGGETSVVTDGSQIPVVVSGASAQSANGMAVSSAVGAGTGPNREGVAQGVGSLTGGAADGNGGTSLNGSAAASFSDRMAGSVAAANPAAGVKRGLASEIAPEYLNLFSVPHKVLSDRCDAGRLNCYQP